MTTDPLLSPTLHQFWQPRECRHGIGFTTPFGDDPSVPFQFIPQFRIKVADWHRLSAIAGQDRVGYLHFNRNYRRGEQLDVRWLASSIRPQEATHPCSPSATVPPAAHATATAMGAGSHQSQPATAGIPARKLRIDTDWVRQQVERLQEPFLFWDIETAAPVIPRWRGFRIAQSIPFLSVCMTAGRELVPAGTSIQFFRDIGNPEAVWDGIRAQLDTRGTIFTYSDFEWVQMHDLLLVLGARGRDIAKDLLWLRAAQDRSVDLYAWAQQAYHHPEPGLSLKVLAPRHFPDHYLDCTAIRDGGEAADRYTHDWVYNPCGGADMEAHLTRYCTADAAIMPRFLALLLAR